MYKLCCIVTLSVQKSHKMIADKELIVKYACHSHQVVLKISFYRPSGMAEGLDGAGGGGVWNSLFIKNLARYSSH